MRGVRDAGLGSLTAPLCQALHHPHIIKLHQVVNERSHVVLMFEFADRCVREHSQRGALEYSLPHLQGRPHVPAGQPKGEEDD